LCFWRGRRLLISGNRPPDAIVSRHRPAGSSLANLGKFSNIGLFSAGSLAPDNPALADPASLKQKVKLLFVSYDSRENTTAAKANHEALEKLGVKNTYEESPDTAHKWQTWRHSLRQFAPLLFQD
jgi:enterochelin esterase family protein